MAGWTWLRVTDRVGPRAPIRDPATADGARLVLTLYDVVAVDGHRVRIARSGESFDVDVPEPVGLGDVVTVAGTWDAAHAVLVADRVEDHPDRTDKGVLGVAGLLFLGLCAPFWFRIADRRVVSRA